MNTSQTLNWILTCDNWLLIENIQIFIRLWLFCFCSIVLAKGRSNFFVTRQLIKILHGFLVLGLKLSVYTSLSLAFTLQETSLLLCLLFQFCKVVLMCLSLSVFVELIDHLIIVSLLTPLLSLLHKVFVDDLHELLVPLIEHLWCHLENIRLVEQEPVRVLAFEYSEVRVKKGAIRLK